MKSFRRAFALLLTLAVLLSCAPLSTPAHAASTVGFTMEGFYDYKLAADALALINEGRAGNNIAPVDTDAGLAESAMTRAAEVYVYADAKRPDGAGWKTALKSPFYEASTVQAFTFADTAEAAVAAWTKAAVIMDDLYTTAAVGCFRQTDGATAWVLLYSNAAAKSPVTQRGSVPVSVDIKALPSNLGGQILHHSFSNAYCACYLFAGTTVGTALQLLNVKNTSVKIAVSEIDYSYTTSDDSVFHMDNDAHTITAVQPGTANLSILVDGQPILIDSRSAVVEVWEAPALTYTQTDNGDLHIYYGDFGTQLNLYMRDTSDDMYWMANIEADGTYEYTHVDPNETYTCVMRYYDKWLGDWVVIGEPLIIKLGDKEPTEPEPTPTPTPTPAPAGSYLPTRGDLPKRTFEPTMEEVQAELQRLRDEVYPEFEDWGYTLTYNWAGGSAVTVGKGDAAYAMAVSDLIFGTLPAKQIYDMTVTDLRPGDIICDRYNKWYVVQDISPLYIITTQIGNTTYPDSIAWGELYPITKFENSINFVLTRYTSDPVGAEALHPSIVPADAWIIDEATNATYINNIYSSVVKWTMASDGTLYLEGIGRPGYGDDDWKVYKDKIERVVFGEGIVEIHTDSFKGYPALEEIVLSDTFSEIPRSSFADCTNLKSITFGKGLQTIGENAFQYSGLESLVLPDSLESIGAYAFSGCAKLKSLYVPASITQWGNNVFTSCDALEELTLADGLTTLGYSMFNHLDSLKTVTIPGSIQSIPKNTFYFSGIETLILEEGVEVIEEYAFGYCRSLKEIHLPNTLTTVKDDAFRDAENVTDVYFYGTEAEWANVSIGTSNDCLAGYWWSFTTIHFVDGSVCFHKNVNKLPATEPTCENEGLTEGSVCADCGAIVTAQEVIPAPGHDYVEVSRTEATCTTTGSIESVCTRDKNHRSIKFLAPTGIHTYEDGYCTVCGEEEPVEDPVMENPFTDVRETDWYFAPIMWAKAAGVTGGKTETTFGPNDSCTRAQVVTFLWAAAGKPEPQSMNNPFTDVAANAWYLKPVLWAVEQGITGGVAEGKFGPEQTCTRAQIATFLYAAAGKPPVSGSSTFNDVADSDWFAKPVIWAAENNVTGGIGNNNFGPNNTCTRGQVVTFLYKVYG